MYDLFCFGRREKPLTGWPNAELLSIAVLEKARGRGVAGKLYESLGERFFEEGETAFSIVVGESLAPARRFYEKMGAVSLSQISVHKGQSSILYQQNLPIS